MSFSVNRLNIASNDVVYYDIGFRVTLETMLPKLISSTQNTYEQISPSVAQRQIGDFYGLLLELGIRPRFHWIILRVNNYLHPSEYQGKESVILPSQREIETIVTVYLANHVVEG